MSHDKHRRRDREASMLRQVVQREPYGFAVNIRHRPNIAHVPEVLALEQQGLIKRIRVSHGRKKVTVFHIRPKA